MTLRLYQAGLQVITKNVTTKYGLYQAGLQVVLHQKNPVYDLYQAGLQVVLRRQDMPQHAQYSFYDIPLEIVYEPAPETVQFSHCLEPGYFFAVDHFGKLTEGGTITVRVYGGVPPYTWALDVGTTLALSATETDDPYVTLSITGAFTVGTEELTVEDACGSQATVCVYLCDEYIDSSYTCTSEFSCDEHCRRIVVPIEPPPTPPPPEPPVPPEPPEPPLAPHETEILTAAEITDLSSLNLLIVSFWNDPENTEVRLLWDLDKGIPYDFVTKAEYDARYGFLSTITWLNDLLIEGGSAALATKNWQKYPDSTGLEITDFGYQVIYGFGSGCGIPLDLPLFVPLWCEDSETICYVNVGSPCGGVNYGGDQFDNCFLMPPWDTGELTVNGRKIVTGSCSSRDIHTWPSDGGPEWNTWYEQTFYAVQRISGLLYFNVGGITCAPWSYPRLYDSDVEITSILHNIIISAIDLALGANETHHYVQGGMQPLQTDPGDWGSISLVPGTTPYFTPDPSFIRTSLRYSGTYFHQGLDPWDGPDVCTNFAPGVIGAPFTGVIHEELFYDYFTHFGSIGLFYPHLGITRGETAGHRKLKIVANADLQCQIFLFQRSETVTYISGDTVREGTFHAALETGELKGLSPEKLPRKTAFEDALNQLFDLYYTENDYDSGGEMSSKIDPNLEIRVGVASNFSVVSFFELPLEVVYERN